MKILLVNSLYYPTEFGGAERVVRTLANELRVLGHDPVVATLAPRGEDHVDVVDGIRVRYVGLRNVYWIQPVESRPAIRKPLWHAIDSANPFMAATMARILDAERPDVVHTHNVAGFSPSIWAVMARRHVPVVHTLHDHYVLCPRSTMFAHGKMCEQRHAVCALYSAPRMRLSRSVTRLTGVSRYILDRHLSYGAFGAAPATVVRNPCRFAPTVPRVHDPRRPLRMGYIGRLESGKGVDLLLGAAARLREPGWELRVAGTGTPEYELAAKAAAVGLPISFVGEVSAEQFLPDLDLLVVPSLRHDPSPTVVLEAFAFGVPVVGARRGGIPEMIEDGRTGFLFEPDGPATLAARLQQLITERKSLDSMRAACVEQAGEYSIRQCAQRYEGEYVAALTSTD